MIVPPYKIQLELQQQFSSSHSSSSSSFSNNQQETTRSWMTKRDLIEFIIHCGVIESGRSSHGQFTINSNSISTTSHHLPSSQNNQIDHHDFYYYPVLIDGEYIGVGTFQILKFVQKQLRFLKVWSLNEMGKIPEISSSSISSSNHHKMRDEKEDENEEEMIKLLSPTTEIALIPPIIIKEEEEKDQKDENQNQINSPSKKQQKQHENEKEDQEDQNENKEDQNQNDENDEIQFGVGTYPGLFIFLTSGNRFMRPVINLEINHQISSQKQIEEEMEDQKEEIVEEEEDQIFNSFNNSEYIGSLSQVFLEIACLEEELKTNEEENQQNQISSSSSSHLTSHLELDSTNILSIIASFTPFSDFNQSPRNMYQVFILKQRERERKRCHNFVVFD